MLNIGFLFLLLFTFLKAEYVVEIKPSFLHNVKSLGIDCLKYNQNILICNKGNDKTRLKRFLKFLEKNGVNAKIANILNKNILNIYSIQIMSTKKKALAEKEFNKYKKFPFARLEKIGQYYTIRIGASKNAKTLEEIIKKYHLKSGFIRVADIKLNRIIKSNFLIENNALKHFSFKTIQKKSSKIKKKVPKEQFLDNSVLNEAALRYNKEKNYKKLCDIYTILSIVKNKKKYSLLKNKWCYAYFRKKADSYDTDIEKIVALKKAIVYKKQLPDLIYLNYLEAKNFEPVNIKFLDSVNIKKLNNKNYNEYIKTLLFSGDIKQLKKSCSVKKIEICTKWKNFFKNHLNIKIEDKDIKGFENYLNIINENIKKGDFDLAKIQINNLLKINKNNLIGLVYLYKLNLYQQNISRIKELEKILINFDKNEHNNTISELIKKGEKLQKLALIKEYLSKNNLGMAQKIVISLLKKFPNDFEVNVIAGDIFDKTGSYLANLYYHRAYLINKKKFLYHLLEIKNYKRLANYKNNDLKTFPYILAKFYLYKANQEIEQKKYKNALKYALQAYDVYPSTESSKVIGKLYFLLKDYKNCIKYLKGIDSDEYLIYYLGYSYYKIGNKKMALYYLNKILGTKNISLKKQLIAPYIEMGEKEKVKKILNSL